MGGIRTRGVGSDGAGYTEPGHRDPSWIHRHDLVPSTNSGLRFEATRTPCRVAHVVDDQLPVLIQVGEFAIGVHYGDPEVPARLRVHVHSSHTTARATRATTAATASSTTARALLGGGSVGTAIVLSTRPAVVWS